MYKRFADIIIDISTKSLDRPFSYGVPDELLDQAKVGSIVEIPFGAGNRMRQGYIIDLKEKTDLKGVTIKAVAKIYDSINVESELIQLARWMRHRYVCTMQAAMKALLPAKPTVGKRSLQMVVPSADDKKMSDAFTGFLASARTQARARVIGALLDDGCRPVAMNKLLERAQCGKGVVEGLEKLGLLRITRVESVRNPFNHERYGKSLKLDLNSEQQTAVDAVAESVLAASNKVFLLHGITGSGKTEVYLQIIEKVLARGESVIVLIPEIALTPQTVERFASRFGDVVGIMHSRLSQGERYDQWRQAKEGKLKIMIGPRSAVFTPFEKIGLIVLDEEHETAYKSETNPKYHAREVAIFRARHHRCPVLLGSATPLVDSYYKAGRGDYVLLELLKKAATDRELELKVADMRTELAEGNKSIFSRLLQKAIKDALDRKEQVMLFLNRRGHSGFVSCRQCGLVLKCSHCDISYTYHAYNNELVCHYCNERKPMVDHCPACGSKYIKSFGIGTQKVEKQIKELFPEARVLRMDFDTTSGKHGHEAIIEPFKNHKADILVGTQMIAKGHHFDKVSLVGVLAADLSLHVNDFRASERTYQLLAQVVGRTGRSDTKGLGIIQTYSPDHYSIQGAIGQDYKAFYRKEIAYRRLMGYPPFGQILVVLLSGTSEKELIRGSYEVKDMIEKMDGGNLGLTVLGPSPATVSKIRDVYRRVLYVKHPDYKTLTQTAEQIYNRVTASPVSSVLQISCDVNPMMSF